MELKGKKVLVVGLGVSGRAAALLCLSQGALVRATDHHPRPAAGRRAGRGRGEPVPGRPPRRRTLPGPSSSCSAPGWTIACPRCSRPRAAGAEVIGELELGWRFTRCPTVMITGTNGKSTVTTLVGDILAQAGIQDPGGRQPGPAGVRHGPGEPRGRLAGGRGQLLPDRHHGPKMRPRVGVVLNITPDHLDRYPDFEAYADSKMSLLSVTRPTATWPCSATTTPRSGRRRTAAPAQVWGYGADGHQRPGGWLEGDEPWFWTRAPELLRVKLPAGHSGPHQGFNRLNCLAACLAALACGAHASAMERSPGRLTGPGPPPGPGGSKGRGEPSLTTARAPTWARWPPPWGPWRCRWCSSGRTGQGRAASPTWGRCWAERAARVMCFGEAGPSHPSPGGGASRPARWLRTWPRRCRRLAQAAAAGPGGAALAPAAPASTPIRATPSGASIFKPWCGR